MSFCKSTGETRDWKARLSTLGNRYGENSSSLGGSTYSPRLVGAAHAWSPSLQTDNNTEKTNNLLHINIYH